LSIAAQIAASAQPFEVLVSRTVCDLVGGSSLQFSDRSEHSLARAPDIWKL
jgi:class 3 adenylate cyclase